MITVLLWCLSAVLILTGLAGTILPLLPGTVLMLAGMGLGAWIDDFERVSAGTLALLATLTLVSLVTDVVGGALGARREGASPKAVAGAAIGALAGVFTGLVGLLVMPLVGAAIGEYLSIRNLERAGRVGLATGLGILVGTVVRIAFAFAMLGIFAVALVL